MVGKIFQSKSSQKLIFLTLILIATVSLATSQNCPPNCAYCNSTSCTHCNPHYYLNINSTCSLCPFSCDQCLDNDICLTCSESYYLHAGMCFKCPRLCLQCSLDNAQEDIICTSCSFGSYLSNDECLDCMNYCLSCDDNITCNMCVMGWFYNVSS